MRTHSPQHGMALISALLLLLVITILGVGMFRSFGLQERIAGNTREKEKALHAANTGEAYAEWWLTADNGANATTGVNCSGGTVSAASGGGQVCSNSLATALGGANNITTVPWVIGGAETAVTYTPPNFVLETSTGVVNGYYTTPRYYISFISTSNPKPGITTNVYQIDSLGYGSNPSSVAVVETGYVVSTVRSSQSGLQQYSPLGGP